MTHKLIIISVIIPAKNESAYLKRTLSALWASIDKSGYRAEVILADNESDDDSSAIALSFGCTVLISHKKTIAGIRNDGAEVSSGKYIAFLDADCIVHPDWIAICIKNLKNEKIIATGTRAVPSATQMTWVNRAWFFLAAGSSRGENVSWLGTSNIMLKRSSFFKIGGFSEDLQTAEDVDFCIRLAKGKIIRLEKSIDTVHLREATTLRELFSKEVWRGKGSLRCFVQNGYQVKEFPSIAIPFLVILLIFLIFALVFIKSQFALFALASLLFLPVILMIKKGVALRPLKKSVLVYIVAITFIAARSCSLLADILKLKDN